MDNRNNYQWRPNDKSPTTITRYQLEAQHWQRAFKSLGINHGKSNNDDFGLLIKYVFQVAISSIILLIIFLVDLIKLIIRIGTIMKPLFQSKKF